MSRREQKQPRCLEADPSSGPLPRSLLALHQYQAAGDHNSKVCPHMQDHSSFSIRYSSYVTLLGSRVQ